MHENAYINLLMMLKMEAAHISSNRKMDKELNIIQEQSVTNKKIMNNINESQKTMLQEGLHLST